MKLQALLFMLLGLSIACDKDEGSDDKDESSEEEDEPKTKKKKKKAKGPEVQSCTLEAGCSEYRSKQFRETVDVVKDTCKKGGGKYAQAPCATDKALGKCKRNVGMSTESTLVIFKIGTLTAEQAKQSCADGEWTAL